MAVADGHGGSRYWLSDVGSRLACDLALQLAAKDLAMRPLSTPGADALGAVRQWLADELPSQLVAAWQEAIQADWQQRDLPPEHQGESFSSQTYGSTLALVVLTPHWWAHTGLGDWDLVLLSDHQPDQLISQEADKAHQGEATESLCLPSASRCFASRTAVYPLSGDQRQACGLVLSTDGIRKSCATDADHLALSRYLLEEAQTHKAIAAGSSERLDTSLDRISREGSGDDVSVALACFGSLQPGAVPSQPVPMVALPDLTPLPRLPEHPRLAAEQPSPQSRRGRRQARPTAGPALLRIGVGLATGSALLVAAWVWLRPALLRPFSAPTTFAEPSQDIPARLTATQQNSIQLEIKRLCRMEQALIESTLNQRKEIPKHSREQPRHIERLLADNDWQGSLIALNRPGSTQQTQLAALCPALNKALKAYWAKHIQPQQGGDFSKRAAPTDDQPTVSTDP
jgi:hypothetical protein